jgi:glycosyltransferase involved in cell wall biosynthesis
MKLSILIPTVKEREEKFNRLFDRITSFVSKYNDVEVLFNDAPRYDEPNGLTVGEKRQALIDVASGKYIMFVDDDDDVLDNFIESLYPLLDHDVDVINANVLAYIDGIVHIIDQSIYYESEQLNDGITKRYPSVTAVWNRELTKKAKFISVNYGEDFDWTKQMNPQTELKVNTTWQVYKYSSEHTIASKIITDIAQNQ